MQAWTIEEDTFSKNKTKINKQKKKTTNKKEAGQFESYVSMKMRR
jgi:hypothetical protein